MALPTRLIRAVKNIGGAARSRNQEEQPSNAGVDIVKGVVAVGKIKWIIIPLIILIAIVLLVAMISQIGQHSIGLVTPWGSDTGNGSSGTIVATNYVEWAVKIAEDDSHGYDQGGRDGPDYDCSSLVWHSLVEAGGFTAEQLGGSAFTTYGMANILVNAGFREYSYTSMDDLQAGDILLRGGHTEIYIGDGKNVGAHINEFGKTHGGQIGDQTGREIYVSSFSGSGSWSTYYRLVG